MQEQTNTRHDNQFWIGLFLGGLIGAFLIVLLGTEKGKKLAKKLQEEGLDFWDDAREKIEEKVGELEGKGEELVEKGKELIAESKVLEEKVLEKAIEVKETATQQATTTAYDTLSHIEAIQERGRQATAELKKRLFKNIPRKT